jgi:glycosyltransferase involved in cell wall biosynthesis
MDDERTPPILAQAREQLGPDGFTARSVPYEEVAGHYRAADAFTLGSVREGFGRVYIEALIHGLPSVVHDGPVMRYVMGDCGTLVDFEQGGTLAAALQATLATPDTPAAQARRRQSVRERFGWPALAPQYRAMFARAAEGPARASAPTAHASA